MKRKIRAALDRLNGLYGKGKVFGVNYDAGIVTFRIQVSQSQYGPLETRRFRFDGRTVFYLGHQQKIGEQS